MAAHGAGRPLVVSGVFSLVDALVAHSPIEGGSAR
jgi:hypothetical protein